MTSSAIAVEPDATVTPAVDVSPHIVTVGKDSNNAANATAPSFEAAQASVTPSAIAVDLVPTVNPVVDVSPRTVEDGDSSNNASDAVVPLTEAASAVSLIINKE